MRAGKPRIPLKEIECDERTRKRPYTPIELINENGSKGLFAVLSTDGFDLYNSKSTARDACGHVSYILELSGNELREPLLESLLLAGRGKAHRTRNGGTRSLERA